MSRPHGCHRYCPNCWRVDWHDPLSLRFPVQIALAIATLGCLHLVWPIRCRTCGNVRPRNWNYRQVVPSLFTSPAPDGKSE